MTDAPIPRSSSGSDELIDWLNDQIRFHGTSAAANDPAIQGHIAFLQRAIARLNGVAQRQPELHAWRFVKDNGQWSPWIVLPDAESVTAFKDLMGHNLDRGTHQLQSFFAAGPSLPSTQRCTWPNCDQPSGHDYCYSHCLADRGAAVASTHQQDAAK